MSVCSEYFSRLVAIPPRVRLMRQEDIVSVLAIEKNIYDFPWSLDVFMACQGKEYESRVTELGRQVVGYAIMQLVAAECHLLNLGVDSAFQGNGLGRRLLQHMLDDARAKGARRAILEVRLSNEAARVLYAEENFSEIGLRKNYYPTVVGREDALVLARLL